MDMPKENSAGDDGDGHSPDVLLDLSSQDLTQLEKEQFTLSQQSVTVLNLNNNNLLNLPADFVGCVPHLHSLTANGNQLKTLPRDFGCLTCLTRVELCENKLTSLPDSIQCLVNLKQLRLAGNHLPSLPDDFGEMSNLEELYLENNELTRFPSTFALLDKLRILNACANRLQALPNYLGFMHSLTELSVRGNKLTELPANFSQLEHLESVDVSDNQIESLPSDCSSQKTLKRFDAGRNRLTLIPGWLAGLPEITKLSLNENNLSGRCFPDSFGQVCQKLRYLDLSGNKLTSLPESLGQLQNLEFAHFGLLEEMSKRTTAVGNWLQELPISFLQLTSLTRLRLDRNMINGLPEHFGALCNLQYLNLGDNTLHDLPESFGDLKKLRVCLLFQNRLQLLPSSFGQLTALEELHLDNNKLAELPESFQELTQLKTLDLHQNKLMKLPCFLIQMNSLTSVDFRNNPLKALKKLSCSEEKNCECKPCAEVTESIYRGRRNTGLIEFPTGAGVEDDEVGGDSDKEAEQRISADHQNSSNFCRCLSQRDSVCPVLACIMKGMTLEDEEDRENCSDGEDLEGSDCSSLTSQDDEDQVSDDDCGEMEEGGVVPVLDEEDWGVECSLIPNRPADPLGDDWHPDLQPAPMASPLYSFGGNSAHIYDYNQFSLVPSDLHVPDTYHPRRDPGCLQSVGATAEEGQYADDVDS